MSEPCRGALLHTVRRLSRTRRGKLHCCRTPLMSLYLHSVHYLVKYWCKYLTKQHRALVSITHSLTHTQKKPLLCFFHEAHPGSTGRSFSTGLTHFANKEQKFSPQTKIDFFPLLATHSVRLVIPPQELSGRKLVMKVGRTACSHTLSPKSMLFSSKRDHDCTITLTMYLIL